MFSKRLGKSGIFLPEVGLGTYDYRGGPELLRRGLEAGACFIDTAESYGTEDVVGAAIRGLRDQVVVATKVSSQNFRESDLKRSVDASLHRLRISVIDLLQLHHPNPSIPIEETVGAIGELVKTGKVRFIGVSNFSVAQLDEARRAAGALPIVSNQVRYNLIDRTIERGLLQYCQRKDITVIAYSPLGRGLNRIYDCDSKGIIERIARCTGKPPAAVVLNWCLCKEGVIVIPRASTERHLLDNCSASDWRLSEDDMKALNTNIQYRHRNRLDAFVRKSIPLPLQRLAKDALHYLPRNLRRRFQ
jgi:diketogulonate reductase-like aldo/keto reductase